MENDTINGVKFQIVRLLGKGKGGYSYLAERDGQQFVIKQIHHEPCDYYQFGNKLKAELRDYAHLSEIGIPMPKMLDVDTEQERILKEYIEGETVMDMVKRDCNLSECIAQVQQMCTLLYPAQTNIDYFPTNFVMQDGTLYYIDYECNPYSDQWNFENWGIRYWSKTPEFLQYWQERGE